jgi:hypothetical protein
MNARARTGAAAVAAEQFVRAAVPAFVLRVKLYHRLFDLSPPSLAPSVRLSVPHPLPSPPALVRACGSMRGSVRACLGTFKIGWEEPDP